MADMVEQAVQRSLVYASHDTLESVSWVVFLGCTVEEWVDYNVTNPPVLISVTPSFGEGTCPEDHAEPRRHVKEA